jgi:CHAT domain-containing protein/tetratricopeptide (TPR) repeat protein
MIRYLLALAGKAPLAAVALVHPLAVTSAESMSQDSLRALIEEASSGYRYGASMQGSERIEAWSMAAQLLDSVAKLVEGSEPDAAGEYRLERAKLLLLLGDEQTQSGDFKTALAEYHKAARSFGGTGEDARLGRIEAYMRISRVMQPAEQFDSMRLYGKFAREIAESLAARDSAMVDCQRENGCKGKLAYLGAVLNEGSILHLLGDPETAIQNYRRLLEDPPDLSLDGAAGLWIGLLTMTAEAYDQLGRPDSAMRYMKLAWVTAQSRGEKTNLLSRIGYIHYFLGEYDSALAYHTSAVALAREQNDRLAQASGLINLGTTKQELGDPTAGLPEFRDAVRVLSVLGGNTASNQAALGGLAGAFLAIGGTFEQQPESALAYMRHALALSREIGAVNGVLHIALGAAYAKLKRPDSALAHYREAVKLLEERLDQQVDVAYQALGELYHRQWATPALAAAIRYYEMAARGRQLVRSRAGQDPQRLAFAESNSKLFQNWSLAWLARAPTVGKPEATIRALSAAEAGRGQALLDLMLATSDVDISRPDMVERWISTATGDGASLLYYLATEDTLMIWSAGPRTTLTLTRLPISRDSIRMLVATVRAGMAPVEDAETCEVRENVRGKDYTLALQTLSHLLLPQSVRQILPPQGEVLIIPHDVLSVLPFAILHTGQPEGPLFGLRHAIRYSPSLGALGVANSRTALPLRSNELTSALIVGNPVMPSVPVCGREIRLSPLRTAGAYTESLARKLGAEYLTTVAASKPAVRRKLAHAPLVHMATHGYAFGTEARARDSWIALAPTAEDDGLLTVGEILDGPSLQAELVVLAACESGLGNLKHNEGTVGFQRAFLAKGARSVLVSLWTVSEAATVRLLQTFYDRSLQGMSKAEALRQAQEELAQGTEFQDPRYWAAFQLFGAR